jgi:hypothetical protein
VGEQYVSENKIPRACFGLLALLIPIAVINVGLSLPPYYSRKEDSFGPIVIVLYSRFLPKMTAGIQQVCELVAVPFLSIQMSCPFR